MTIAATVLYLWCFKCSCWPVGWHPPTFANRLDVTFGRQILTSIMSLKCRNEDTSVADDCDIEAVDQQSAKSSDAPKLLETQEA